MLAERGWVQNCDMQLDDALAKQRGVGVGAARKVERC
jgi:hypothetical protein